MGINWICCSEKVLDYNNETFAFVKLFPKTLTTRISYFFYFMLRNFLIETGVKETKTIKENRKMKQNRCRYFIKFMIENFLSQHANAHDSKLLNETIKSFMWIYFRFSQLLAILDISYTPYLMDTYFKFTYQKLISLSV